MNLCVIGKIFADHKVVKKNTFPHGFSLNIKQYFKVRFKVLMKGTYINKNPQKKSIVSHWFLFDTYTTGVFQDEKSQCKQWWRRRNGPLWDIPWLLCYSRWIGVPDQLTGAPPKSEWYHIEHWSGGGTEREWKWWLLGWWWWQFKIIWKYN